MEHPFIPSPKKKLGIAAHPKGPATPEMKAGGTLKTKTSLVTQQDSISPWGYKSQVWWLVHTCILNK